MSDAEREAIDREILGATPAAHRASNLGVVPVVPADVVAEWWRGRSDIREHILWAHRLDPRRRPARGTPLPAGSIQALARIPASSTWRSYDPNPT